MGRKPNQVRLEALINIIEQNDGKVRAADIAKQLHVSRSAVTRLLPAAEQHVLLMEDDRGFLGIFKKLFR